MFIFTKRYNLMKKPISYLGYKINDKLYNYDFVGTNKMLVFRKYDRTLLLITKDGMLISETRINQDYTFEEFIAKAKDIFTAAIDSTDNTVFNHSLSWS